MGCGYSKDIHKIKEYGYKGQIKIVEKTVIMNGKGKQENSDGSVYVGGSLTTNIMDMV